MKTLYLALLLYGFGTHAVAQSGNKAASDEYYRLGQEAYKGGNYLVALENLSSYKALNREAFDARPLPDGFQQVNACISVCEFYLRASPSAGSNVGTGQARTGTPATGKAVKPTVRIKAAQQ